MAPCNANAPPPPHPPAPPALLRSPPLPVCAHAPSIICLPPPKTTDNKSKFAGWLSCGLMRKTCAARRQHPAGGGRRTHPAHRFARPRLSVTSQGPLAAELSTSSSSHAPGLVGGAPTASPRPAPPAPPPRTAATAVSWSPPHCATAHRQTLSASRWRLFLSVERGVVVS
eukprot:COSAG01_NODE_5312_length_4341_cov_18.144036_2_plen_170_part_00